jgi:hypothetical protein
MSKVMLYAGPNDGQEVEVPESTQFLRFPVTAASTPVTFLAVPEIKSINMWVATYVRFNDGWFTYHGQEQIHG